MADVNLADIMEDEDELPRLTRGRSSEDYDVLIQAMQDGKPKSLKDIEESDRQRLGQKIRGAAAKAGFKVTVRYSKPTKKLYFQRILDKNEQANTAATSTTTGTKTK